jgi:hypothetical protein
MAVVRRLVVPPGKNKATEEEWFDTEIGRVVPKPADGEQQTESAPETKPSSRRKSKSE